MSVISRQAPAAGADPMSSAAFARPLPPSPRPPARAVRWPRFAPRWEMRAGAPCLHVPARKVRGRWWSRIPSSHRYRHLQAGFLPDPGQFTVVAERRPIPFGVETGVRCPSGVADVGVPPLVPAPGAGIRVAGVELHRPTIPSPAGGGPGSDPGPALPYSARAGGSRTGTPVRAALVAWLHRHAAARLPTGGGVAGEGRAAMPRVAVADRSKRWGSCNRSGTMFASTRRDRDPRGGSPCIPGPRL